MSSFEKGAVIGKYRIVGILGSGGMGMVYEAIHVDLKKRVALKTLHPEYAQEPIAQARFVREGEAASRIRHPHVVDVTDIGNHEGVPFLVMEYLEGMDLAAYLIQKEKLPLAETLDLMLPVVAAVAAGHDEGVVHRDLKPHNIFLAGGRHLDMHPKVLDFGVSKVAEPLTGDSNLTATAAMMGTVAYMSPEQAMGAKLVDGRSDQYALALILYECLTGRRAHEGDNTLAVLRQIGDGAIDPPSAYAADVPAAFEEVLMKALALDARGRYSSMYAFGRALLPFASPRAAAHWDATFRREPQSSGLSVVSVAIDQQPSSTRVRTLRQGSGSPRPAGESPAPAPVAPTPPEPAPPTPQYAKTMALPLAVAAAHPAITTLGQSASEIRRVEPPAAPRSRAPIAIGGAVAAVGIVAALLLGRSKPAPPPEPSHQATPAPAPAPAPPPRPRRFHVSVAVTPPEAQLELDGLSVGQGTLDRDLTADGREHTLRATAPGFETATVSFLDAAPAPTLALVRTAPAAPEPKHHTPARPRPKAAAAKPAAPSVGANQAPILKE